MGFATFLKACSVGRLLWSCLSSLGIDIGRRLFLLGLGLILLVTFPGTGSAVSVGATYSKDWPHLESDLLPDPDVRFGRLPSGVRYALMANKNPRDRVVMHLVVQAGSLHETEDQRGLAHFLEHMMFNGSTHFPPGELVKYFQSIGMQFGADANASTGFTETIYDVVLPDGSEERLTRALTVLSDYAEGALLLESEIDRERGIILAEKRTRDSAAWRTYVSTLEFQMPSALLPRRLPIGDVSVIAKADRSLFKDFYETWYRPERMILVVVGDMDLTLTERLIRDAFGRMQPRADARSEPRIGTVDHKGIQVFYHREEEAGNTTVSIETLVSTQPVEDSSNVQQEILEELVANRMLQNRLDRMVTRTDSPFTSASVGSGYFLRSFRYSGIEADCTPENWEVVLKELDRALRQALVHGFESAELDRVKKEIEADLEQAVVGSSTRESRRLAREMLYALRTHRVFRSPAQERDFFVPRLRAMTLDQVQARLEAVWSPAHRLVMVTGNADLADRSTTPEVLILSAYEQSRKSPVAPPEALASVAFPYLPDPEEPGRMADEILEPDLGIERIRFANGFHLHLKRTDFSKGEIQFVLALGDGRASEPAAFPGIAELASAVLNDSGLGALRSDELEWALAGTQTRVAFGVREDHFHFSGRSVPGEEKLIFQILYAFLKDPAFREEALRLSLERLQQDQKALRRSVEGAMELFGDRFFAGGDSRFGQPAFETVRQITLENIRSWMGEILAHAPLELSVVGDFDSDAARKWAALYLGSLPDREPQPAPDYRTPIFPSGQKLDIQVETEIDKALLVAAFPTDDMWDIGRTRRLSVLADVVSEQIREIVREKLGAAYSPYAYNLPSRAYDGYGKLLAVVQVDPTQVGTVLGAVREITDRLSRNGVGTDELKRAVEPTLTSIKDMLRRNSYWLNTVLRGASRHPEQLSWSRTIQADYASITPEDISTFARNYLVPRKLTVVTVRPAES